MLALFLHYISISMSTIAYTALVTWLLLKIIDKAIGLCVTEEQEIEGLDVALHGERAYEN